MADNFEEDRNKAVVKRSISSDGNSLTEGVKKNKNELIDCNLPTSSTKVKYFLFFLNV